MPWLFSWGLADAFLSCYNEPMIENNPEMKSRYAKSLAAFAQAKKLMPGGVSSPVRAFGAVGRTPVTVAKAKGPCVTDIDGNLYIDYIQSYGPLILGHADEGVLVAINKATQKGTSFGMPCLGETKLASKITEMVPSIEMLRFVNSGTEATMSALRLARAATGRDKIVKFIGCYHGHHDSLLVEGGSGMTTLGCPSSPGVPKSVTQDTLLLPFNDLGRLSELLSEQGHEIAAVIVEPIAGNMGCIPPATGYLEGMREFCSAKGIVLIFDEVMTGFRVAPGGAQEVYGVQPDLTCLGKVVGGGLPCAVYGGKASLMQLVSPQGAVYQAGTLSGNPLAMAAGLAMLEGVCQENAYQQLEALSLRLAQGLSDAASQAGISLQVQRVGSMLCPFMTDQPVTNYQDATACSPADFAVFFGAMLDQGIMIAPSLYETWFVSLAHDSQVIDQTIAAAKVAYAAVAAARG